MDLRRIAGIAGAALVGLLLVAAGTSREHLRCERASDSCAVTSGPPGLARTDTFAASAIRDHRFSEQRARSGGRRGATVLVDASGREFVFARDAEDAARAKYEAIRGFFAGERPDLDVTTGPAWWLAAIGVALALAAPWMLRARPAARASAPADEGRRRGARAPLIALVVGGLVLVAMTASLLASRTQGSLALRCTHRCEVDGGTCMPGGEMVLTLAPGEHELRVWNRADPARPLVQRVTVVRGQVTHHECAP